MKQAEMELKKGQNMVEHEAEIFARPARTWFQSEKEKAASKGTPHVDSRLLTVQRLENPHTCPVFRGLKKIPRKPSRRTASNAGNTKVSRENRLGDAWHWRWMMPTIAVGPPLLLFVKPRRRTDQGRLPSHCKNPQPANPSRRRSLLLVLPRLVRAVRSVVARLTKNAARRRVEVVEMVMKG